MLDQGKHTGDSKNPSAITIVFQDATPLGNNSGDRTKKLLELLKPTGIAITKEDQQTDNMVLLVGEGYTDKDALELQKEIEPMVMFYKNPAEIKVDQEGHLSIRPKNPIEVIGTPSKGAEETKANQKTSQDFFSAAYPRNGILKYEQPTLLIPSSADIDQTEEVTTEVEPAIETSKSREELIREFRIQEKIVELSKEELNKKLGGPEKAEKMLQEIKNSEAIAGKIPVLKSTKIGQSLSDCKEVLKEVMDMDEENNFPELEKLSSITDGLKIFNNEQFAASIDTINTYEAYKSAQADLDETVAQLEKLDEPIERTEENEKEL